MISLKRYATILVFFSMGCTNQENRDSSVENEAAPAKEPVLVPDSLRKSFAVQVQVTEDDSVFNDGSIPSSWQSAGITDVQGLKQFVMELQVKVASGDKEAVSAMIRYPLAKSTADKLQFIEAYDKLITTKVKEALANVNLKQLFRNQKGVMIGKGEIWINQSGSDFKIIAINP